jgi:dCMP deaminase
MTRRLSRHSYYMNLAVLTGMRTTCARRRVGAVLIDQRGIILSIGYNGVPQGFDHCNEGHPCKGAGAESGTQLGDCKAIHAEINALLWCADVSKVHACYLTVNPCNECLKVLLNTDCQEIYYLEKYSNWEEAERMWNKAGRGFYYLPNCDLRIR